MAQKPCTINQHLTWEGRTSAASWEQMCFTGAQQRQWKLIIVEPIGKLIIIRLRTVVHAWCAQEKGWTYRPLRSSIVHHDINSRSNKSCFSFHHSFIEFCDIRSYIQRQHYNIVGAMLSCKISLCCSKNSRPCAHS